MKVFYSTVYKSFMTLHLDSLVLYNPYSNSYLIAIGLRLRTRGFAPPRIERNPSHLDAGGTDAPPDFIIGFLHVNKS